jgi:hypothetical protein
MKAQQSDLTRWHDITEGATKMNSYTLRITNHTGNGYTKTVSARTLPTALRKTLDGMLPPRHRKAAYIEHIDGRINPFHTPHWAVISNGERFATIELVS